MREGYPIRFRRADDDPRQITADLPELLHGGGACDHAADAAAVDPILDVVRRQQRRGRADDRAELDEREHRLPQRDLVAQHEQHAVVSPDALFAKEVGHLVRPDRQAGEGTYLLGPVLVHDVKRLLLVTAGDGVEVVERPVEFLELRPPELANGRVVVGSMEQAEIARVDESLSRSCELGDGHLGIRAGMWAVTRA